MGFFMGFTGIYPLVMSNIAIENGHRIVSFPINSMVIFHSYVNVYQRVTVRKMGHGIMADLWLIYDS